jgi:anaerobic magnesium-protoporphyrin IX monomethyl ester cyclase
MTGVVLINPEFMGREPTYQSLEEVRGLRPPLGILSLGSYLRGKGYHVRLLDINPYSAIGSQAYLDELGIMIREEKPSCIGLSVMTSQVPNAYFISRFIRSLNPDLPIIWGGVHPTLYPAQTSQDDNVDLVVHGPGEDTLLEIIQRLETGESDFSEIRNLAYKGRVNPPRKPLDVNEIPFLDYELLDIRFYQQPSDSFLFQKDVTMLPMLSSRGCPHRCAFCINNVLKTGWRAKTPERFLDELEYLVNRYSLDAVRPLDENFFVSKRRVIEIIKEFRRRKIHILWGTNVKADCFQEDFISTQLACELREVGFTFASIGAESGSPRILELLHKDITIDDIIRSAKICHEAGIIPAYSWMIGIPTETKKEMLETIALIRRIKEICPTSIHYSLNIYRPFPGGELYELCKQAGLKEPRSLAEWVSPDNLDLTLGAMPVRKLPWIKERDFVIFMSNYTNEITGKLNGHRRAVDYLYSALIKLRYKLGFFRWPNTELRLSNLAGYYLCRLRARMRGAPQLANRAGKLSSLEYSPSEKE